MKNVKTRPAWEVPAIITVVALAALVAIYGETGCKNPNTPIDAVSAAACVASRAIGGETVAQIAIDCRAPIEEVITDLLQSADPNVRGTNAELEARRANLVIRGQSLPALGCEYIGVDAGFQTTGHGK